MNRYLKFIGTGVAILAIHAPTQAADQMCPVRATVQSVIQRADGYVSVKLNSSGVIYAICNVNGTLSITVPGVGATNITPDVCKGNLATFMTAKAAGRSVEFMYWQTLDCSAAPAVPWTNTSGNIIAPYPYYINLVD